MASEHLVKSFDEQLERLNASISEMGGLAESQLQMALDALSRRDTDLAQKVIAGDARVDQLEKDVAQQVVRLLALRQPMAIDLRGIISALKISSDIERIADYAANLAKRSLVLSQMQPMRSMGGLDRLGRLVLAVLKDVFDAFATNDVQKSHSVWLRDQEVDDMYTSLFRELLTYMMEDPRNITACTHLLFMAKNIERIGDHATNVAELIQFKVTGKEMTEARPKGDKANYVKAEAV
ncbi:MAG: phoU [Alphaproteobacteria bacterium]|jgi:phosphate transport system protein|nr:phoU [Alphaproteobacteria bacterium]